MASREEYEAAKQRQRDALEAWRQVSLNVNRIREELGEAGELDCEFCAKERATRRCRGCGRWFCANEFCHTERCG